MKVTLTTQEILTKFGLSADTELVIEADRKLDSGEWISNNGHPICYHPKSLSADTKIEVRFRDGGTDTGYADEWVQNWKETDGFMRDIIAYRILED